MESLLYERPGTGFDLDIISFDTENSQSDPSYHLALARWAAWVVKTYDNGQDNGEVGLRKNIIILLASALAPGKTEEMKESKV